MTRLTARRALLPTGWAENVAVTLATDGRIEAVETGVPGRCGPLAARPRQPAQPRVSARHGGPHRSARPRRRDSFWTWRRLMFRFLDRLTPDHVEAIAAQVQMEMLEAGYASLAEFHYLHHRPDGGAYDNPAEMSDRIAAAAQETGIGLTLLPVLYQTGGCDGRPLGDGQRRFGTATDDFATLMARAATALAPLPDANLGMAPHSLRAVPRDALALVPQMTDGPLHMHLAEQQAEVEEVQSAYGARPVEWALDNMALGPRWCLIHLTQMTEDETARLAPTGAVAGLCPITEANLGDGIFNATGWRAQGGAFGMGSDSNVLISLTEELRQLEYSQRLRDRAAPFWPRTTAPPAACFSKRPPGARPAPLAATRAKSPPANGPTSSGSTTAPPTWPDARATRCSMRGSSRAQAACAISGPPAAISSATGATSPAKPSPPATPTPCIS